MKKEQRERDYSYSRKKEILITSKTFRGGQSKANNTNKNASSKTLWMMLAPSVCNNACINTILFSP